jgi:hypothetical protein
MRAALLAGLAVASMTGQAQADEKFDGNALLTACSASERVSEGVYQRGWEESKDFYKCIFYMAGVVDTVDIIALAAGGKGGFCIPDGVTRGQTARVVVAYLKAHPKDLHTNGSILIMVALADSYPCAQGDASSSQ